VRILVTGASGQVARSLQKRALARGVEMIAVGRPELDIPDEKSVAAAVRRAAPDAVINARPRLPPTLIRADQVNESAKPIKYWP
jgi:dTDP-4-dehydrorhamnose reductase